MRAEAQAHVEKINAAMALVRRFIEWDRAQRRLHELNARVLAAGDGDNAGEALLRLGEPGEANDLFREAEPGSFSGVGGMVDTAVGGDGLGERRAVAGGSLQAAVDRVRGEAGEVLGPGGRAVLVGDDADLFALAGEAKDGEQEVFAARAVNPAGAEDHVRCAGGGQGLLAGKLGGAVDAKRAGGGIFDPGLGAVAREDVVGGKMQHGDAEASGFLPENFGRDGVDGVCLLGLAFRLVDRGVGRRIDDQARGEIADELPKGVGVAEVKVVAGGGDHVAENVRAAAADRRPPVRGRR